LVSRKKERWVKAQGGNVSLMMALCAVPLLAAVAGATELYSAANERSVLQNAVDAGALAGAGRLSVASSTRTTTVTDTAVAIAQQNLTAAGVTSKVDFTVSMDDQNDTVTLSAVAQHKALIGFNGFGDMAIHVNATAENLNVVPLCVLQTGTGGTATTGPAPDTTGPAPVKPPPPPPPPGPAGANGIVLQDQARIRATGCAIHANQSITVNNTAMIMADRTQAVGTAAGHITPNGNSGAMVIDDPFASMDLNPPTDCVGKPEEVKEKSGGTLDLAPGVHCEHFVIDKFATLHLEPGEHYFMDNLDSHDQSIIEGDDVVLIFGSTKKINFADKSQVRLSARKSGPFAGFLIVTTRDNHEQFTIASDNVSKLLGTIYIPEAQLLVQTTGNVAQDSAWSIIVADSIKMAKNPTLVINTGYVGSGVPVPDGVGPGNGKPKLTR